MNCLQACGNDFGLEEFPLEENRSRDATSLRENASIVSPKCSNGSNSSLCDMLKRLDDSRKRTQVFTSRAKWSQEAPREREEDHQVKGMAKMKAKIDEIRGDEKEMKTEAKLCTSWRRPSRKFSCSEPAMTASNTLVLATNALGKRYHGQEDLPVVVRNWTNNTRSNSESQLAPGGRAVKKLRTLNSRPIPHPILDESSVGMEHGKEEVFDAHFENSQTMMQNLSLTQTTQPNTQLTPEEEEKPICHMKLVLHEDVQSIITEKEKLELIRHGLFKIEITTANSSIKLGRDKFTEIFKAQINGVYTNKLSRIHCVVELQEDFHGQTVILTDQSTNGTRIDGQLVGKSKSVKLEHGQTVNLLTTATGRMVLGYTVEDPCIHETKKAAKVEESALNIQQEVPVQQNTLGVLFAAPLVGKDLKGECHAMDVLDLRREYGILVNSLCEATKMATRGHIDSDHGYTMVQVPQNINISFKFATTDTFRQMLTVGCRALHFSGHGNETHLYFEDGFAGVHPVPHESLRKLFAAGGSSHVRLAFVSACSSAAVASAFLTSGVPHVVAVKLSQKIEDQAAIEFTKAFYLAIASGRSVASSFHIAQQAVANSPLVKISFQAAEKFQLLPDDADHSEVIFPLVNVPASKYATTVQLRSTCPRSFPVICPDPIPAVCQGFAERTVEVYKLCVEIMHRSDARLITICGPEGVGKTDVAYAVAKYTSERRCFEGGVSVFSMARMTEGCNGLDSTATLTKVTNAVKKQMRSLAPSSVYGSDQPMATLLVLDGCDYFIEQEASTASFRRWISDCLTDNPALKVLTTARTPIAVSGPIPGYGERVFGLKKFGPEASARLLLNLSPRPIFYAEMKKVLNYKTLDLPTCVARHPALREAQGNPKRIAELATKLNQHQLDALAA